MKCPYCGARIKRTEYFCPVCGEKLEVRNQTYPVLKYSIINAALFTFVVPVIIDLIFEVLHIPFIYDMLLGWVPGLVISAYILRQYYLLAKEGKYSALKGMISTVINIVVIMFALMMIITTAFDFVHMYTAKKNIEADYDGTCQRLIANTDTDQYYFEIDGEYYIYDMADDEYYISSKEELEDIQSEFEDYDDGTYFIMK